MDWFSICKVVSADLTCSLDSTFLKVVKVLHLSETGTPKFSIESLTVYILIYAYHSYISGPDLFT